MPCPLHSAAVAYNGGPAERVFVWMLILLASQRAVSGGWSGHYFCSNKDTDMFGGHEIP